MRHRKFTQPEVEWIRWRYREGGITQQAIADALGISRQRVNEIVSGQTYSSQATNPNPPRDPAVGWQQLGACRDESTSLFFPARGEDAQYAKTICSACPVKGECLDVALADPVCTGVWGGTSEYERRRIRKERAQAHRRTKLLGRMVG